MTRILDAYGLLVFLEKEVGFEKVRSIFVNAVEKDNNLLMTSVNYGEVYYIILRECGQEKLNEIEKIITTLPIDIINVDIQLAREAARFKVTKKISYADCFAAALAKLHKGEVITGDKEFKTLEDEVKILWII
ncbi:MAG: type II toxin-antitoxin system VapC family toxin [Actinobacteria bacterium]|nr:type II toxin-antitoxin system VapC family toxin [Chloroflexota bacterium]MBE3138825.1 type II toxin-antitoxin system VapC family toxin [Actinomycetota bacterium]